MSRSYSKVIEGVEFREAIVGGRLGIIGLDTKVWLRPICEGINRWAVLEWDQPIPRPCLAKGHTQALAVRKAKALFLGQVKSYDVGGLPISFRAGEGGIEVSDMYRREVLLRAPTFREAYEGAASLVAERKQQMEGSIDD